jgi:hypothetical protein
MNYALLSGGKARVENGSIVITVSRRRLNAIQFWMNLHLSWSKSDDKHSWHAQPAIANVLYYSHKLRSSNVIPGLNSYLRKIDKMTRVRRRFSKIVDIALRIDLSDPIMRSRKSRKPLGLTNVARTISDNKSAFGVSRHSKSIETDVARYHLFGIFWHAAEICNCELFGKKECLEGKNQLNLWNRLQDDELLERDIEILLSGFKIWREKFSQSTKHVVPDLRLVSRSIEVSDPKLRLPREQQDAIGMARA